MKIFRIILLFSIFVCVEYISAQQWNNDAGLVVPYHALISVSSGNNAQFVNDGNPATFWASQNPLPTNYIKRSDLNLFLTQQYSIGNFTSNSQAAFDGNTDTKIDIKNGKFRINFSKPITIKLLSVKIYTPDTVFITAIDKLGKIVKFYYSPTDNYKIINYKNLDEVAALSFFCRSAFSIFEIAGLDKNPEEFVLFDFGKKRTIGWISTRSLNEVALYIKVFVSEDKKKWQKIADLNPKAIPYIYKPLNRVFLAKYLKVVFGLPFINYKKAALWEMNVYDRYGPYGKPFAAVSSDKTWAETFGINTVWGWGYSVYTDLINKGKGPDLFRQLTNQLRVYHNLNWDISSGETSIDYHKMAQGNGTPVNKWLNWDREYGNWKKKGFSIDVTLTFNEKNFPDSLWTNPYVQAFAFGKSFGKHFIKKTQLVDMLEIGNEPWNYPKKIYYDIFSGMAKGVYSVSGTKVLPCAVQAYQKQTAARNYIANFVQAADTPYIKGLNTHIYPYIFDNRGKHIAVIPEDRRSQLYSMANLHRYIMHNMPGKKIYVTEFGYDSNGGGENCIHSECVSETEQATYGVRMALILWRLGAEKLYWYFFANINYTSFLHNRSGLTSSYAKDFRKKLSFEAFKTLYDQIGNFRFDKVLLENNQVYAYLFINDKTKEKTIIAWQPVNVNNDYKWVDIPFIGKVQKAVFVINTSKPQYKEENTGLKVRIGAIPLIIKFKVASHSPK